MIIQQEISLSEFDFWYGAKYLAARLTDDEFDNIEDELKHLYKGMALTAVDLNDMFWHEPERICELIGLDWENEVHKRKEIIK